MLFFHTTGELAFESIVGDTTGGRWTLAPSPCGSPTCGCEVLSLAFHPLAALAAAQPPEFIIGVDVGERVLAESSAELGPGFARSVVSEFGASDWEELECIFRALKESDWDGVDLTLASYEFPFGRIENDGLMIAYNRVFPLYQVLCLQVDGVDVIASDRYCLRTSCGCEEIAVSFFDARPGAEHDPELFCIRLHAKSGRWTLADPPGDSVVEVRAVVEAFLDRYDLPFLRERRRVLSALYERERAEAPQTVRRSESKVGRNDPCPCGSGRRFEKCCGC